MSKLSQNKQSNIGAVTCRFCRKISKGTYYFKLGEHEYEITNHGYYPPDKCIWWEAVNLKTNEADFHETAKKYLLQTMIRELS